MRQWWRFVVEDRTLFIGLGVAAAFAASIFIIDGEVDTAVISFAVAAALGLVASKVWQLQSRRMIAKALVQAGSAVTAEEIRGDRPPTHVLVQDGKRIALLMHTPESRGLWSLTVRAPLTRKHVELWSGLAWDDAEKQMSSAGMTILRTDPGNEIWRDRL